MSQPYHFSAGPTNIPLSVKEQLAKDIVTMHRGLGILEISHRSPLFDQILQETEDLIRQIGQISQQYHVLFLQGGATQQFWQIPAAFTQPHQTINVIHTGFWTQAAMRDARFFTKIHRAYDGSHTRFRHIPPTKDIQLEEDAQYTYYCSNNSFFGTQWKAPPQSPVPLVADVTSDIFSRPLNLENHAIAFASTQKNLGCAGLCLVIIDKDFLKEKQNPNLPNLQNYQKLAEERSMLNTPPIFSIHAMNLTLKWIQEKGGLSAMQMRSEQKAKVVREALDTYPDIYSHWSDPKCHSNTNICFSCNSEELNAEFVQGAERENLWSLGGHKKVGGLRASLFNALPLKACTKLAAYIHMFAKKQMVI